MEMVRKKQKRPQSDALLTVAAQRLAKSFLCRRVRRATFRSLATTSPAADVLIRMLRAIQEVFLMNRTYSE
jgi:hypothetical protein